MPRSFLVRNKRRSRWDPIPDTTGPPWQGPAQPLQSPSPEEEAESANVHLQTISISSPSGGTQAPVCSSGTSSQGLCTEGFSGPRLALGFRPGPPSFHLFGGPLPPIMMEPPHPLDFSRHFPTEVGVPFHCLTCSKIRLNPCVAEGSLVSKGLLHGARAGGAHAQGPQRDPSLHLRDLREDLWPRAQPPAAPQRPLPGEELWLPGVWEGLQALLHTGHPPADPLGHPALPLPLLREALPPEVRHEEAHLHPHR
ncbi:zinc finger protein Gfi-1b isoform X3 [Anolis carolinensis]|uniref:zinc finger protein Gfi-1b isoform X3 n=1 Tax=Anolis carolinensis TaxID=28377 RepID=UPI002F2B6FF5